MNHPLAHLRIALTATVVLLVLVSGVYPLLVWGLAQLLFPHQANGSLVTRSDGTVIGSTLIAQGFASPGYFHPRCSEAGNGYDPTSSGGSNLGPTSARLVDGATKPATPTPASAATPATPSTSASGLAATPTLVVDHDGYALRVLHYCDDNGLPCTGEQDGKPVDLAAYRTKDGWDEVRLITAFSDANHPLHLTAGVPLPADAIASSASGLDPDISPRNAHLQAKRIATARHVPVARIDALIDAHTLPPQLGFLGEPRVNVLLLNLALDQALPGTGMPAGP